MNTTSATPPTPAPTPSRSFAERLAKTNPDSFCFIVGSFAETTPKLRAPTSDIDVLVSEDLQDQHDTIRMLMAEHPRTMLSNHFSLVPLDVSVRHPIETVPGGKKIVTFSVSYWQATTLPKDKLCIPLLDGNGSVDIAFLKTGMNIENCLRDPNKRAFIDYVNHTPELYVHRLGGLDKAASHYGGWAVVLTIPGFEKEGLWLMEMARLLAPKYADSSVRWTRRIDGAPLSSLSSVAAAMVGVEVEKK